MAPQGSSSIYNNRYSGYVNNSNSDGPKCRLPYFNGKNDFQSFWTIFQIGMRKFNWNRDKQIEQLLCLLKDDALTFVTKLPASVQGDIHTLYAALKQRYGDYLLPEQYRENLNQIRKTHKETLTEYASRVSDLVNKAYPLLSPPELVTALTIENLLRGLPDQALAYEVRTKSPKTIDETIRLVTWHECCKNGGKKQVNVRCVEQESESDFMEPDIRKVSNIDHKYVTEARLTEMNKQIVQNLTGEINKLAASIHEKLDHKGNHDKQNRDFKIAGDFTCFSCHEKGHTSRRCPNKSKQGNNGVYKNSNYGTSGTSDKQNSSQSTNWQQKKSLN